MLSAAEAAVQLARHLGIGLELWVNEGRDENQWGGKRLLESRRELLDGLPNCKIVGVPWRPWPAFRKIVRSMDILFSPSFDETFNVITAVGIAEGVPSVVTGALEWTPTNWHCKPWDPTSIMETALGLLHHQNPTHQARTHLEKFVRDGTDLWVNYVVNDRP